MKQKEIGLYIHIPFCKHKCNYCDFCSYENKEELISTYIKWLKIEIQEVSNLNKKYVLEGMDMPLIVKTIYIGGGTPSYIDSNYIVEIIKTIKDNYIVNKEAEITIEVNPRNCKYSKIARLF